MTLGGVAVTTAALLMLGGVAANAADLAPDPLAAVAKAAPQSLVNAAKVPSSSSGSQAMSATIAGTDVVVPVDPGHGIQVKSERGQTSVGLPFAAQAHDATAKGDGVVSYDNNNGSSTVPIVQKDGAVQINTVIRNSDAPKRYGYPLTVSAGQSIHLAPDGSAYVAAATGVPSLYIAAPWAKDANGKAVSTHFEVNGTTLTQVVDFTASTAFPVVADPTIMTTGQADYNCVLTNGSSYFMAPGSPLTNCKGSYLQKYYNGVMVKSVGLVYNGKYTVKVTGSGWCILALAGGMTLAFTPVTATITWFVATVATAGGIYASCKDFV